MDLRDHIRDIPGFPKAGIVFRDITPLLLDPRALDAAVAGLAAFARPLEVELIVAAEARGFILGGALARELGVGFVPARKPGKLPWETVSVEDVLEYDVDALEMHADALAGGTRVTLTLHRRLRGVNRLGGFLARRAAGRVLDEALDGLERACGG